MSNGAIMPHHVAQVVIYECGTDYLDSDTTGQVEVDSTNDYTGLVSKREPLLTRGSGEHLHQISDAYS